VAKRVGSNGLTCQSVLKETGWVEDLNLSTCSDPSRSARQHNGPACPGPLIHLKKIK